jgi:hypothetical protein
MGFFGTRIRDIYSSLPCIVGELTKDVSFPEGRGAIHHERASRVYFVLRGESPLLESTAEVFVRSMAGKLWLRELPWDHFRFAEIAIVPSKIAEPCWRGAPDEMLQMLEAIRPKLDQSDNLANSFSVPIDSL